MLSPGDTRPGEDRTSADTLFRAMCRVVPDSGIQFLDIAIPRQIVETTERSFTEETVLINDETVYVLAPALGAARDRDAPEIRIAARSVVQSLLGQWIPLPYLRFVARDGTGKARFDSGPTNWARLFLSPRPGPDPDTISAVIVLDTRVEPRSRLDLEAYLMPTVDDVRFSSVFALTDDAEELAPYLAEPWLQDWVADICPSADHNQESSAPQSAGLHQIAAYLTLLTVLRRAAVAPSLQFFDTSLKVVEPHTVDVVLDLGTSRSAALLVENRGSRPLLSEARLLALRNLSDPTLIHRGAFDSRVAFARAQFGNEVHSRRSGRADAFTWPSLVRTGPEANLLAARTKAADGAVGLASPKAHLRDTRPRNDAWRFLPDHRSGRHLGPMISGPMLAPTTTVRGLLTGPTAASTATSLLRPQHPLSTMTSFLIAEIVLQSCAMINAPSSDRSGSTGDAVRHLRQIILPVPLTMPREDRDLLRARAEEAVAMVWQALGWSPRTSGREAEPASPPMPMVRLGLDETLAVQLAFLYDEIAQRHRSDARTLLDLMGKSRPEFGIQPCLRLGAIDIGGGHATMTIVTYASQAETSIVPTLLGAQRSSIAGNALLDGLAATFIIPAIAAHMRDRGGEHAEKFLSQLTQAAQTKDAFDPASLGVRLVELWLRPAALTLLEMADGLVAAAAAQDLTIPLGELVSARGPLNPAVGAELAVAAEAIRTAPFDLADVEIVVRLSDITASTRDVLEPMLTSLSRALVASDCDGVLLTGWAARLGIVRGLLIEQMPWRPDRIIPLANHAWQSWYPMRPQDRAAANGKDAPMVGALLALAGADRMGFGFGAHGFAEDTTEIADGWRSAPDQPADRAHEPGSETKSATGG